MRRHSHGSLPVTTRRGGGAYGANGSGRRWQWIAVLSLVVLALLSMAMFSSSPLLQSMGSSRPTVAVPSALSSVPLTKEQEEVWWASLTPDQQRKAYLAEEISRVASQWSTDTRGIVLPLYDKIALLGISLIMELRAMRVDLPIEVPHCGDLDATLQRKLQEHDPFVRVYDVCAEAATISTVAKGNFKATKLFCKDVKACHGRFRSFDIKIIALLLSRFQEVMMLDADTLFFESPMTTWESDKYQQTGILFFHDRISCDQEFLAAPRGDLSHLQQYLSTFDVRPFRKLESLPRDRAVSTPIKEVPVGFEASEFLMTSHSWNRRAGHQADSSLMLWNKQTQPRATAILGSFIAHGGSGRPPSYGDKEFYFIACELAETAYAFSDYGVGAIGNEMPGAVDDGHAVLCGDALHYQPDKRIGGDDPAMLYMNSDHIVQWKADTNLFRSKGRPASLYPGKIEDRKLRQECPFDLTIQKVLSTEKALLSRRQHFYEKVERWKE